MRSVIEIENHARESRRFIAVVSEIARHPETQAQPDALGIRKEMLAVAMDATERMPDKRTQRSRAEDAVIEDADSGDGLIECVARKIARIHLDFRKLRHADILACGASTIDSERSAQRIGCGDGNGLAATHHFDRSD